MTDTAFRPTDEAQLVELVAWACAEKKPLEVRGTGTKRGLGAPGNAEHSLDMTGFTGLSLYEPAELVMSAGAGISMAEVEATLSAQGQHLAFEPPDLNALLGTEGPGTLGGVISCNLAGPRRIHAGAARDHFLGFRGVSGRGEAFKSGARVVKNVTGFDLPKLMAGSMGTLVALRELTIKVLPAPEAVGTVLVLGLDDETAGGALSRALGSAHEVTGAAHLPGSLLAGSALPDALLSLGKAVTLIRVEGPSPSVAHRVKALRRELSDLGETHALDSAASRAAWAALRDVKPLVEPRDRAVWRISVAPMAGARVVESVGKVRPVEAFYDWGGGLVWLATDEEGAGKGTGERDGGAQAIRAAVAAQGGGHATLLRGSQALRAAVSVFQPQPGPVAALSRRLKDQYDPHGILNPGRL
ncbi:MAG: FAD-binding protein [Rhodospirillum sp.]|nr:FAD-binding protein [Rhodospirillum sp.]MCF8488308.1 FAD-binding protein [Rhodospirillum sp.]MCF8502904.1 FAD-binding protein [Rhodospirillum sp.]